ncbi:cytochrome b/b6 domain-containing protein [Azospirillum thermophilum]|nr:cytochrome b/b6 domain-containing protein [Azospirillum thermophilum]
MSAATSKLRVWDLPTRLFHWLLAVCVAAAWWSGENGKFDLHFILGYVILGLLAFRLLWGFVGSPTARFAQFVRGPAAVIGYIRHRLGKPGGIEPPPGHNPLGGWMVVVLLLVLAVQAGTGLFTSDDIAVDGPLVSSVSSRTASLLSTIHRLEAKAILALVLLHVAAVLVYLLVFRENLIRPMVTGWKSASRKG